MFCEPVEDPLADSAEDAAPRGRILIVEDDESIAELLSLGLEQQGFETAIAASARSGLEQARTGRPDLVLLDLHLPDQDGLAVSRVLDDDPATELIPRILLSGVDRPDVIRSARSAGCRFYVRKPYDPDALLLLIEQALREARDLDA